LQLTDIVTMALANKDICTLKNGINRSTGLKVMAKKLLWPQMSFLAITFKPVDGLSLNFE